MTKNKTQATGASVEEYIASKAGAQQSADCSELIAMLTRLTGQPPYMWGPSIVGFGTYRYTYASGHSGEAPLASFAIRGKDLVVYLSCEEDQQRPLLAKLGKHKIGKACLHIRQLADIDLAVLEELVVSSISEVKQRFG